MSTEGTRSEGTNFLAAESSIDTTDETAVNKMGPKQKAKYQKLLKNQGKEAAIAYRQKVLSGETTGGQGNKKKGGKRPLNKLKPEVRKAIKGEKAVEKQESEKQIEYQNPDYSTPFGGQRVTFDENGNPVYESYLSDANQNIVDQGQNLTDIGQDKATTKLEGYKDFTGDTAAKPYQSFTPGQQYNNGQNFKSTAPAYNQFQAREADYQKFNRTGSPEERARIEDAVFTRLTRNLDRDKGREMEAKKQELHNRGIPYSDDPNSQYQKQMGDIHERYDAAKSDAMGQAVEMGGGEMQRSFGMDLAGHQTGMADRGQLYTEGLTTQQQKMAEQGQVFGEGLATHRQGVADEAQRFGQDATAHQMDMSDQAQLYNQNLTTHQQGMQDMNTLQNQGAGFISPSLPGYSAPGYELSNPTEVDIAMQNLKLKQQELAILAAKGEEGEGGEEPPPGGPVDASGNPI